jgi:N-methylhydantoinase A
MRIDRFDAAAANALLQEMAAEAHEIVAAGAARSELTESRAAYMRYVGQGHEIPVKLPDRPLREEDAETLRREFERVYEEMFARFIPHAAIEVLTWTVTVSTTVTPPAPSAAPGETRRAKPAGRRPVFDPDAGREVEVPLYWRPDLARGDRLEGPAVIAEDETSTFVSGTFSAYINAVDCIVLEKRA